jgi:uncharacterized protein (TIGR04141 family)
MAKIDSKNIVSFYKIDRTLFDKKISNADIIKLIIAQADGFKQETQLSILQRNGFNISMFYLHKDIFYSKWESFFATILKDPNDTFNTNSTTKFSGKYLSFVCFFEKSKEIFALCMGKGYIAIEQFIETDFGFNLLTRLIKPESNFLRQLSANHLSGSTFEDANFFRSSESFLSQDDFGKIFKQAISELDKEALKKLGIDLTDLDKANCLAKSSFMLKTGITLEQVTDKVLPALIKNLKSTTKQNFQINKVKVINKHHPTYSNLVETLFEKIRTNFLGFDFFCPEDPLDFFMAEKYSITKYSKPKVFTKGTDDLTNIENVKKILEDENYVDFKDKKTFSTEIEFIKINALDPTDNSVLRRSFSLVRGLHGEIEFKGNKYFWMNGKFWLIDKDFLQYFSDKVFQNINEVSYRKLDHAIPFNKFDVTNDQREDNYNSTQGKLANFINLDKKIPDNVELCDLLYETSDTIYLIHVKKGFDRDVRVLTSQILTAARFLNEDRNKDKYIKKLFVHGKGDPITISKADFLKKFKKRTIFVFAFAHNKNIFDKTQFSKLDSNIAKLELFELLKDFKKFNPPYDLKIIQLPFK